MTASRFRLNDSIGASAYVTSEGSLCKILSGSALTSTSSSFEGSNAILAPTSGTGALFKNTDNSALTNGTYFLDFMVYIPSSTSGLIRLATCGNDSAVEYSWVDVYASSGSYKLDIGSYDTVNGVVVRSSSGVGNSVGAWARVRVEIRAKGVYEAKLWTGSALPSDSIGGNENVAATASASWTTSVFSNWQWVGPVSTDSTMATGRIDDIVVSDASLTQPRAGWTTTHTAGAAASETASGTAAATATRVMAGAPSITATAEAVAGLVLTALGTPSISAIGSADASVLTTHNAEAASIITVGTTDTLALTQGMVAASTITATATAVGATNTAANGAVQAIGAARAVVEGETSPGFLYATVAKNILTN